MPRGRSDRAILLALLREMRLRAGLTQAALSHRLGKYRSYVSKYETGRRSLDLLELREVCRALGTRLADFTTQLERLLSRRTG